MIYAKLFLAFFKIGLFAIGGAYSFLPLTEREIVEKYAWLTKAEFLEISGFVKMFPGAISVKYATYVGQKMAGIPGALVANLANLLAPACFILFAAGIYNKYKGVASVKNAFVAVQLVVFAMIIAAAFQTLDMTYLRRWPALLLVVVVFCLFIFTKVEPAWIILAAGLLGAWVCLV